LRRKCTKFDFQTPLGELTALPQQKFRQGGQENIGRGSEWKGGKGRGRRKGEKKEGMRGVPPSKKPA